MGRRLGIVAGGGGFPVTAIGAARSQGYECVVAGIRGEASPDVERESPEFGWVEATRPSDLVSFFHGHNVREVLFVGKVDPRVLVRGGPMDDVATRILANVADRTPPSILAALFAYLESQGFVVKDPEFLLASYFCSEGILTGDTPSGRIADDIAFGWRVAKAAADLEVGQMVIVKDKAIIAVEGLEGTDEAISRAGRLAGPGMVAVKVARTRQDVRIDIPAVGLTTLRTLAEARAAALCIEARRVAFFDRVGALALARERGITVLVKKG
jgi:DUF1009 family protein